MRVYNSQDKHKAIDMLFYNKLLEEVYNMRKIMNQVCFTCF